MGNELVKEKHLENHEDMKNNEFVMELKSEPQAIVAGQKVTLTLTPQRAVVLETAHEQKVHLIIVSEDLSYFNHIHPVESGEGYSVETEFPFSGKFHLFGDYIPSGSNQVVNKLEVNVPGNAPASHVYSKQKLTGSSGDYSIALSSDNGKFTKGHKMIHGILKKDEKEVDPSTLDDYLGAKAHVVFISVDDKEYIHVHPEVKDGKYELHTSFPKPGIYRGWIQFQAEGKVHTTDYVIKVDQQQGTTESGDLEASKHKH